MPVYAIQSTPSRTCEHGMNDGDYPNKITKTQVSLAKNFDMTKDGELESRGGSIRVSNTAAAASTAVTYVHEYDQRNSDGTITRNFMIKAGTVLYKYNSSTGVFDSVKTSLSANKPSMVNFISATGADVMLYADGENFGMYDGSSWTDISANFKAGAATDFPRYLHVAHNVCFAAGDDANPDKILYCDPLSPNTNWPANGYLTIEGGLDKIIGIGEIYDYVAVGTQKSLYIITGRVAADFAAVRVNKHYGVSSHWSMVTEGSHLYFANANGIYIGRLRAAEDDGLDVEMISKNVNGTFRDIGDGNADEIEGKFYASMGQIYWTIKTTGETNPDRLLVYSVFRSRPDMLPSEFGPDVRFVWSGYHEGLDYNSIGIIADANGIESLYVGGSDGLVREYHNGYKDDRAVGASTGTDVDYQIKTREETFGALANAVRVRYFLPTFYQKINGSTTIQYIINRSSIAPNTPKDIRFRGNIPYWHDADTEVTSKWGSTIWSEKPILSAKVGVGKQAHSIIFIVSNDGSSTKAEMTWIGYDMQFQKLGRVRGRSA